MLSFTFPVFVSKQVSHVGHVIPLRNLCKESPYNLINVLISFLQSFCNHEIFIMLNLPILLVLVRQREKSQKYFSLPAFNWNLNHSNLLSTLVTTNF